ncbi:GntR family transcriptional regulator [uncultured Cohaesibacter sp.]|uniref:GntR family transcriptional regulator n=1 Tax=uncultured Cohaesibacter sp. TaxID=1002546 RepID=UPI0029C8E694|nr:GntR family transcriptional regulator [uncultured Cohaesibacter sp.]
MNRSEIFDRLEAAGFSVSGTHGPIYRQLADAIRMLIDEKDLTTGSALPPERELAQQLKVGRITVRNAYKELIESGILEVRQGSGTFVAKPLPLIEQPLRGLTSFSEDMTARGLAARSNIIRHETSPPNDEEMDLFGVKASATMLRLDRLRLVDGKPVALELAVVPNDLVGPDFDTGQSLYEALARNGNRPLKATQRMSAASLSAATAAQLHLKAGTPCLQIKRISYGADQRVIELTRSYYRSDMFEFVADLTLEN